jgi:hypothetical protein
MKLYIGLSFSASMLSGRGNLDFQQVKLEDVKTFVYNKTLYISCVNPSHKASLDALKIRYGIEIPIPEKAPKIMLESGDTMIVLQINGLPRETREFTAEEVAKATFSAVMLSIN